MAHAIFKYGTVSLGGGRKLKPWYPSPFRWQANKVDEIGVRDWRPGEGGRQTKVQSAHRATPFG